MFGHRFPAVLPGAFAVLALVLALVGLSGVLTHALGERTRARLILGPGPGRRRCRVIAGLAIALAATSLLGDRLHGLRPRPSSSSV